MKQTILSISILFSLIVFSSCQKQQEDTATAEVKRAQSILTATLEGGKETRTGLDNPENGVYYPHWQETDEIAVYGRNGKQADKFLLHTGAGTATATFAGPEPGDNPVGLYPYSDIAEEGLNDNVLTLELPAIQEYSYRSFGDGAYPMLAVSQSGNLEFKNLCSVLIIPLTGTTAPVESIRFIAHDENTSVSGKATVRTDFDTEPELIMKEGESRAVTLLCGGTYLLQDVPTYFFLVIPPGTYKGGFDLKIISSAGSLTRSVNTDVTFRRSKYRSISTIDFIPEEPYTPVPDIVDLGLSIPWASCNLGALISIQQGYYFAWGETQKKESYTWSNYAFGNSSSNLNKYTSSDGKTILEPEDDAAAVQLGDKWRTPTQAEFQELLEKCSWTWKEDQYSYLVTGPNGNSIFIPAAASSGGTDGYGSTEFGWYWTSSLNVEDGKNQPYYLYFSEAVSGPALYGNGHRPTGASIRPVYGNPPIHASSVSLNHTELELTIGEQVQLKATVLPENTSVKLVSWFSSDNSIASVSADGLVTGTGDGTATITVKTVDGGKTASCRVTVGAGGTGSPSIVDMGLSVGWASFNLGASKPEEPGYHFAWGELSEKALYQWSTYRWCNGTEKSLTKYNNLADYGYNGFVDNLMELDPEDDAAQVYLGQKWRMPTWDEWIELCDNTTWTWTTVGDMGGYKVVSTINGNSLFFPAAGYGPYSQYPSAVGEAACYWSNTLVDFRPSSAYVIYFDTERKPWPRADYEGREGRYSIRPIYDYSTPADNHIYYTSSDNNIVTPKSDAFGQSSIIANTYTGGRGIISFDSPVTEITEEAFGGTHLQTIELPSSLRSIGDLAFEGCEEMTSITIPEGVTSIGYDAFYACYVLSSITIPSTVVEIGSGPFLYCSSLSSFYGKFASSDHLCLIQDGALIQYAPGVTNDSYTIPDGVVSINGSSFSRNTNLKHVIIPSTVKNIQNASFFDLPNLTSVHISSGISQIGAYAFYACSSLTSVTIEATTPPKLGQNAFSETNYCPIYVPAQSVDTYKSTTGWSDYADRIMPVGDSSSTPSEAVDLGLSVGWAAFNVGASSPEEYGDCFAWGETEPKETYSWETYKWCHGTDSTLTKYCNDSQCGHNGFTDELSVLDAEDDAATVHWGSGWRMPTYAEVQELEENTTLSLSEYNGVKVFEVKSKINGNVIYLPIAGYRNESGLNSAVTYRGFYWCSNLISWRTDMGSNLCISNSDPSSFGDKNSFGIYSWAYRYVGYSVRPVYDNN